uniref:Uncharacterized protein n=1 Tax=Lotus japonicus TaxID=34305 RepID=I3T2S1_LOTJA|nr:unknown [Lotus japonicus]
MTWKTELVVSHQEIKLLHGQLCSSKSHHFLVNNITLQIPCLVLLEVYSKAFINKVLTCSSIPHKNLPSKQIPQTQCSTRQCHSVTPLTRCPNGLNHFMLLLMICLGRTRLLISVGTRVNYHRVFKGIMPSPGMRVRLSNKLQIQGMPKVYWHHSQCIFLHHPHLYLTCHI